MRTIDRRFYESPEWRHCKKVYLERVNHLCERCLEKGLYEPAYIVHHKIHLTPETMTPDLMYGFDNLMAVCQACHNEIHGEDSRKKRWQFVEGELVTMGE